MLLGTLGVSVLVNILTGNLNYLNYSLTPSNSSIFYNFFHFYYFQFLIGILFFLSLLVLSLILLNCLINFQSPDFFYLRNLFIQ